LTAVLVYFLGAFKVYFQSTDKIYFYLEYNKILLQTQILHIQFLIQGITKKCCIARGAARLPPNNYTHKAKCATTLTCRPLITALPLSLSLSLRLPLFQLLLKPPVLHKTS